MVSGRCTLMVSLLLAMASSWSLSSSAAVVGMSAAVPVDVTVAAADVDATAVIVAVQGMWAELDARVPSSSQSSSPSSPTPGGLARVVVRTAFSLPAHQLASSQPGTIEVRSPGPTLDERTLVALRHEVTHQYLWHACPQAARDRLFHEAMAVAVSGEVAVWKADGYLSMPQALEALRRADLDTPMGRRALARIVSEDAADGDTLSPALVARLRRCRDQAPWSPTTVDELAGAAGVVVGDALVVLHTVTGEVLEANGSSTVAMPFGSTLKPILVAAAIADGRALPRLKPRPTDPMWACGADLPAVVDVAEALRRSCNGWFLDWAAQAPPGTAVDLETSGWGPVLLGLGLNRLPTDMSEAIGVRSALTLSPRGLAEAWRLLMLTSTTVFPDVRVILRARGTLDGAHGIAGLTGMVAKTGTVRDGHSRPMLGLLVAAADDLVIVRVRAGAQARALVNDVVAARRRHLGRHQQTVTVQTFGLVPASGILAGCDGLAVTVGNSPRRWPMRQRTTSLWSMIQNDGDTRAVCAGGPWQIQPVADIAERPYAGVFSSSPAPALVSHDTTASARQLAARRGSDIRFATSRGRYVEGVLAAEDSRLRGEARVALAKVIDHNVDHAEERHGSRPICDTTHCQTFLGTPSSSASSSATARAIVAAIATPLSATGRSGWLPFSQGGTAPWQERRSSAQMRGALGAFGAIAVKDDVVIVVRITTDRQGSYDEPETMSCEVLRSRLHLPSCPTSIARGDVEGDFMFAGTGAGHGLGLDVETARAQSATGQSAAAILDAAYPGPKR